MHHQKEKNGSLTYRRTHATSTLTLMILANIVDRVYVWTALERLGRMIIKSRPLMSRKVNYDEI